MNVTHIRVLWFCPGCEHAVLPEQRASFRYLSMVCPGCNEYEIGDYECMRYYEEDAA